MHLLWQFRVNNEPNNKEERGIAMEEENVIRLTSKKKKGILRILFSRFGMILVLMIIEIMVLLFAYRWFSEYFKAFTVIQAFFSAGMVFYLINCEMDSMPKLTWLFLIMLFPIPMTIMLWFSRKDIGHRLIKKRTGQLIQESRECLHQDEGVLQKEELIQSGTDDLQKYLNRSGCFPIYTNTKVEYFPIGEKMFRRMLEELEKAKNFIYLEYFIIDEGYMWGSVLNLLAKKAKEGVDVRVMYDGMCEVALLPHDYPKRMETLGIKCKPFTPIRPFVSTQYNYRDHRKIMVIDGTVAFNGGINLSDEYINLIEVYGHWKDVAVMLKGEAAQSFTLMFLQMWNLDQKQSDWEKLSVQPVKEPSQGFVMPYGDCPLDGERVGETVYMDILYRANTYVHIMTPYLILDNELVAALEYAAKRGIDVKMILPGIPDKKGVYALAKTYYKSLLKAGVHLYEYTPGFVHAKVFVSDDRKAVVGSINLDFRSLYHHFECATYLYQNECIADIEADFLETLSKCREVTPETIKEEKISYKIMGCILKVFAPLL